VIEQGFEEGFLALTGKRGEEVVIDETPVERTQDIDAFDPYLIVWSGVDEGLNKGDRKEDVVPRGAGELITWLKSARWFNSSWWGLARRQGYGEEEFHDWVSRAWDHYAAERKGKEAGPRLEGQEGNDVRERQEVPPAGAPAPLWLWQAAVRRSGCHPAGEPGGNSECGGEELRAIELVLGGPWWTAVLRWLAKS